MKYFSILVLSVFLLSACGSTETKKSINTVPKLIPAYAIQTTEHSPILEITGVLEANESISIASEVSGTISQTYFSEGEYVTEGDLIVDIAPGNSLYQVAYEGALSSYNNALASLDITQSATNKDEENAQIAVRQAQIALEQSTIALEGAKKTKSLTGDSVDSQIASAEKALEIAQKGLEIAETNLVNTIENEQKTKRNILENAGNTLQSTLVNFRSSITAADEILGVSDQNKASNDFYQNVLSAMSPSSLIEAQNLWRPTNTSFLEVEKAFLDFSKSSFAKADQEELLSLLEQATSHAVQLRTLLRKTEEVLKNTVTDNSFSQDSLNSLKAKITTAQNSLETNISAITSARQALGDFSLQSPQRIKNAELNASVSQSQVLSAEQNVTQLKSSGGLQNIGQSTEYERAMKNQESAKNSLESAKNTLASIQQRNALQIQSAKSQVDSANSALNQALTNLSKLSIHATTSGFLTHLAVHNGDTVSPGTLLVVLSDTHILKLSSDIATHEQFGLQVGQKATVYIEGSSEPKEGVIDTIAASADEATRRIPIRIAIQNDDARIPANIFASATIQLPVEPNVLFIPLKSLISQSPPKVFVMGNGEDGRYFLEVREVETGRKNNDMIEITKGLSAGELIVSEKTLSLQEQDSVIPEFSETSPLPSPSETTIPKESPIASPSSSIKGEDSSYPST